MAPTAYEEADGSERQESDPRSTPEAASCTSLQDEAPENAPDMASSDGGGEDDTAESGAKRLKACPKCPQCKSTKVTTRGGGTHGKYRYTCHVCAMNWQQVPPHRAYSLQRENGICFRKRAIGQLYKCGRCGEPKKGHKCIYDSYPRGRAANAIVLDPDVPESTATAAVWSRPHAAVQESCTPCGCGSASYGSYLNPHVAMLPAPVYPRAAGMPPMHSEASAAHLHPQAPHFSIAPGFYQRENRMMVPQGFPPPMPRMPGAAMGSVMRMPAPPNGMLSVTRVDKHGGMITDGHMRSVGRISGTSTPTAMHLPGTAPSAVEHGMHAASGGVNGGTVHADEIDVIGTGYAHGSLATPTPARILRPYAGAGQQCMSAEAADMLSSQQPMMMRMHPSSVHPQDCCSGRSHDMYGAYPSDEYRYDYEQPGYVPHQNLMPMWPSTRGYGRA